MPVAGLVLTLSPEPSALSSVAARLGLDPRLTLGEPLGAHLPVVAETGTLAEQGALWAALAATDGVLLVRLAFHDFSDAPGPGDPEPPASAGGG